MAERSHSPPPGKTAEERSQAAMQSMQESMNSMTSNMAHDEHVRVNDEEV